MKIKKVDLVKVLATSYDWEEGDRILIDRGKKGIFIGTIIKSSGKKLKVELDVGRTKLLPFDSDKIVGVGTSKKSKKPIKESDMKKFLDKKETKKWEKYLYVRDRDTINYKYEGGN